MQNIIITVTVCCFVVIFTRKLYHQLMEEILYNPHTMEDAGEMVDHVSQPLHHSIMC